MALLVGILWVLLEVEQHGAVHFLQGPMHACMLSLTLLQGAVLTESSIESLGGTS